MKRVKIMLSVVALMAVVGGALAFEAKKSQDVCIYTKTTTGTTSLFTRTDIEPGTATTSTTTVPFGTTLSTVAGECPTTASVTTRILFTAED